MMSNHTALAAAAAAAAGARRSLSMLASQRHGRGGACVVAYGMQTSEQRAGQLVAEWT